MIVGHYALSAFAPVVLASIAATMVTRTLTIAAMAGVVVATMVSTHFYGHKSFFLAQLRHSGIALEGGQDVSGLKGTRARDCLAPSVYTCTPESTRAEVRRAMLSSDMDEVFVVDEKGAFVGIVSASDVAEQRDDDGSRTVADLVHSPKSLVLADDTIENVVRSILAARADRLPVIENRDTRILIGAVAARDLLRSVNLALHEALAGGEGDEEEKESEAASGSR